MQINRRAFLVALGAAPAASLIPWRTPAAATWVGIDWGAAHSAAVLAFYQAYGSVASYQAYGSDVRRYFLLDEWFLNEWRLKDLVAPQWRPLSPNFVLEPKTAWLREDQERPPPGSRGG